MNPRFGYEPLNIEPRDDPGTDTIGTDGWISAQVFASATPARIATARLTADGYRRTLNVIRNLPER